MAQLLSGSTVGGTPIATLTDIQTSVLDYIVTTGASDNYVATYSPAITTLTAGLKLKFKAHRTNTGAVTLNVNGLGAITLKKQGNTSDLVAGDILVNQIVQVIYDGAYFQMLSGAMSVGVVSVEVFTKMISQTGHGLAAGDWVRYSGSAYVKAQADSLSNADVVGVVQAVNDINSFVLSTGGRVTGLSGLTPGQKYWLSPVSAGAIVSVEPSTVGYIIKPVFIADSTTTGYVINYPGSLITAAVSTSVSGVLQTIQTAFTDMSGLNDCLWNGQVDFAPTLDYLNNSISGGDYSGYYAYSAFDGSTTTVWASSQVGTAVSGYAYIGMKNLKRNVKAIKILTNAATDSIASVKVQYSIDDGTTWVDIQTSALVTTAATWTEFALATYASGDAGTHRLRLFANANPSSGSAAWNVPSIVFLYGTNLDVCTSANAIKYDENGSYPAVNAFDNIVTAYYTSATNQSTGNLYLGQSGLTSAVKAIRIMQGGSSSGAKEVRLSWKQNVGDAWIDLATVAIDAVTDSIWQSISVPAYTPLGAHYFALRPTTNCKVGVWGVYEMEFYCGDDTNINLTANSSDPCTVSFAYGSDSKQNKISANATSILSSALVPGRTAFIYQDRDISAGTITFSKTPVVPQYGTVFDKTKHSLVHFDGTNGSTSIIDEFGHAWSVVGNGAISTTTPKFGTGKIAGTTGHCRTSALNINNNQPFTVEFWWYSTSFAAAQYVLGAVTGATNTYFPTLYWDTSKQLIFLLSSNGSSWNVANVTSAPQTLSTNTWYKMIFEWDGYYYRIWNGTSTSDLKLIHNVKSSSAIYNVPTNWGLEFGTSIGSSASALQGGFEEIRVTLGSARYGLSPIVETSAFAQYDADMHFFDRAKMKMFKGNDGTGWTECQRVFLGEAYMDAHGVTVLDNYALNGVYESIDMTCPTAAAKTSFRHRLGYIPAWYSGDVVNYIPEYGYLKGETSPLCISNYAANFGNGMGIESRLLGCYMAPITNAVILIRKDNGQTGVPTAANWKVKFRAERGW